MSSGPGGSQEDPRESSRNCSWTQSTAYNPTHCSRRRRTEFDQPAEARAKICTCLHLCAYHVGTHRVLACQSFSGQAPSPRLRGFLRQHHLIPSSPSCYGADLLFCSNLLKCHSTGEPNNTWLNHFLGSPLPRDTEFPSEGRRSTAPGRQKQAEAGRATRFLLENMSARDDPMACATDIRLDSRR